MIQTNEWRIILNNTLLQHFGDIEDPRYMALKRQATHNIEQYNSQLNEIQQFLIIEKTTSILDYLITYVRNAIRMGFGTDKYTKELDLLYDYDEENHQQYNIVISKISDLLKSGLPIELQQYKFYLHRILSRHSPDFKVDMSKYKKISFSLERYQAIINDNSFGEKNLSEAFWSYRNKIKTSQPKDNKSLLSAINNSCNSISELYKYIKMYQFDLACSNGFKSPLKYIADKYCISYNAITIMLEQTINYSDCISIFLKRFDEFDLSENKFLFSIMNPVKLNVLTFSINEALNLLEECFNELDQQFGEMILTAKSENWIDWEKRSGKLTGSYTNVIPFCKKSIISMNFDGSISDVCKLAHELGHAYHGLCVSEHSFYNTDFSVITAEMFGLFCENYALLFLTKRFMQPCEVKAWKSEFYFNALRTFLINLTAFHFEKESFDNVKRNLQSPTETYCLVLNRLGLHQNDDFQQYDWMFRSQNFFPDFFYYNFVYVIGEAIALSSIYSLIKNEVHFSSIKKMLVQSGIDNVDNLFNSINQDLTSSTVYDIISLLDHLWNELFDNTN